ncbi:MAG TPA: MBL fold metallo-hydrolase [Anaerolineales bacterium]|nr:MBL fold metallo-hydrolase [Anaerolineales bacterium]
MPTFITCYGGVDEIGGNKILLEDGSWRLFFDFGRSFGRYGKYFDGVFISERPQRGLLDLLALEVLPPLPGLLRNDLIPVFDPASLRVTEIPPVGRQKKPRQRVEILPRAIKAFWDYWRERFPEAFRDLRRGRRKPVDAILISHAHLDHIGDMIYVSPEIPVCGTRMTAFIGKAMSDLSNGRGSGMLSVKSRALTPDGFVGSDSEHRTSISRPWHFVDGAPPTPTLPNSHTLLDNVASFAADINPQPAPARIKLKHWPVDHSLFGAVGYAVETDSGWVAYTGDIRFTGMNQNHTRAFAEQLAALRPAALLCEGTRINGSGRVTEAQVHDNCLRAVKKASGKLIVADFSPRNVERLLTFVSIAETTNRILLVQPKDAYLLRAMHLADPAMVADVMANSHVKLHADPKARPAEWETRIRAQYESVGPAQIQKNPADYILAFSLTDIADMLDLDFLTRGETRGVYIFSNSQAYDDEQNVDLIRLWNWTQRLGLEVVGLKPRRSPRGEVIEVRPEVGFHSSGHASAEELAEFARSVNPKSLIPIHTSAPGKWAEMLKGTKIELVLPKYARPIRVD